MQPFYKYRPCAAGLRQAIEDRSKYPVDRETLVNTLERQYAGLNKSTLVAENIRLLLQENTFTVCTAHQPNLLTGYLYFIYKIVHAIKLAEELTTTYPDKHFVPVFYVGSEDNDLEELGTFRFRGERYTWDGQGQRGAVGRMKTAGLKQLFADLFKVLGPPGKNCEQLEALITNAYLRHDTIGEATHYLLNELFGQYGLVVLNPDEPGLKAAFSTVMEDELLHQQAFPVITNQIEKLAAHYKIQAHPRLINLFYLGDNLRERIELQGATWGVVDTQIKWTRDELLRELKEHPERFSPNVMLRGLYQETILPDVAFIGGGAEVAYWLQLKTVFEHYGKFYPCVLLRQSVQWIDTTQTKLMELLGFTVADVFKPETDLVRTYIAQHSTDDWQTQGETIAIEHVLQSLRAKASALDPTLKSSAEAALAKIKRQLSVLETKMLRAEKKKMQVQLSRISKLKQSLFPGGGLQERTENFSEYYLEHGEKFTDIIKKGTEPLGGKFLVV